MKYRYSILILFSLIHVPGQAEELLVEFKGTGNRQTEEFKVDGPWVLDYSITSDYAGEAGVEISLVDAVFLGHKGVVLKTRFPGAGTKLFRDRGRFRLRIHSMAANWRLKISRVSEEEADAMIPK